MAKTNLTITKALDSMNDNQGIRQPEWLPGACLILKKGKYPIELPAVQMIRGVHPKHFEFTENDTIAYPELIMCQFKKGKAIYEKRWIAQFHDELMAHNWEIIDLSTL